MHGWLYIVWNRELCKNEDEYIRKRENRSCEEEEEEEEEDEEEEEEEPKRKGIIETDRKE